MIDNLWEPVIRIDLRNALDGQSLYNVWGWTPNGEPVIHIDFADESAAKAAAKAAKA